MTKIVLPPLPNFHGYDHFCFKADELRARDLEVVRVVLQGAANLLDDMHSKDSMTNYFKVAARAIRALEIES